MEYKVSRITYRGEAINCGVFILRSSLDFELRFNIERVIIDGVAFGDERDKLINIFRGLGYTFIDNCDKGEWVNGEIIIYYLVLINEGIVYSFRNPSLLIGFYCRDKYPHIDILGLNSSERLYIMSYSLFMGYINSLVI